MPSSRGAKKAAQRRPTLKPASLISKRSSSGLLHPRRGGRGVSSPHRSSRQVGAPAPRRRGLPPRRRGRAHLSGSGRPRRRRSRAHPVAAVRRVLERVRGSRGPRSRRPGRAGGYSVPPVVFDAVLDAPAARGPHPKAPSSFRAHRRLQHAHSHHARACRAAGRAGVQPARPPAPAYQPPAPAGALVGRD